MGLSISLLYLPHQISAWMSEIFVDSFLPHSLSACVSVCLCVCVCVCCMSMCETGFIYCCVILYQASRLRSFWRFSYLNYLILGALGIQRHVSSTCFYMDSEYPNSLPHTCSVCTLHTESSPHPQIVFYRVNYSHHFTVHNT